MLILNPRLLVVLGLIVGGVVLTTRSVDEGKVREWRVSAKADEVIRHDVLKEGELERAKSRSQRQADMVVLDGEVSVAGPKRELSAENLVAEVKKVSAATPAYVPTVPLMGRLAESMLREDPDFISFGALPDDVGGRFYVNKDGRGPKIVLNSDLHRLHEKGVPIAMIAPILAHELDHFFYYLKKDIVRARVHDVEKKAMVSTAAYIEVMRHGGPGGYTGKKKGDGEVVDGRPSDEEEVAAYYKFLRKVRASLFSGRMDELVHDHYGTKGKP